MRHRILPLSLTVAAALLLAALPAGAESALLDTTLGPAGEIFTAVQGTCGDLFAGCAAAKKKHPALAIDIDRPGQKTKRLLVPGSEGAESEGTPSLAFEDTTGTLLVVWESVATKGDSRLNLARLAQDKWFELIELSQATEPLKGKPAIALTRDTIAVEDAEGELVELDRTILHVAWWEENKDEGAIYYSPVFFIDGSYQAPNTVFELTHFDPNAAISSEKALPTTLVQRPVLVYGKEADSLIAFFTNPDSGRALAFELRVLPGELDVLRQSIEDEITDHADLVAGDRLPELGDRLGGHFIEVGRRLHPAYTGYLASELEAEIAAVDREAQLPTVEELKDRISLHFTGSAARSLGTRSLVSPDSPEVEAILVSKVGEEAASELPAGLDQQTIYLRMVADRPAPEINGPVHSTFLSEDGTKIIVSWLEEGALHYRESSGPLWTAPRSLDLDGTLDLERASAVLRSRVREN